MMEQCKEKLSIVMLDAMATYSDSDFVVVAAIINIYSRK